MDSLYSTTASAIDEPKSLWGPLTIALLASMTQAFGISLQRRAHLVEQQLGIDGRLPFYKRPLWLSGFLIYTLSNIVQSSCTIGYLPIVILAPVGAIGLVFNAVFAKLVLGDPFTLKTVLGTMLIVLGAGLVAGFGVVPEPNHSLQDLIRLYKRPTFIVYFTIIETFICLGLLTTHIIDYKMEHAPPSLSMQGSSIYGRTDLKMWLGISYGVFGANISSQAMLFAKSGLELLLISVFGDDNQFIYPLTWVLVLALIFTAVLQLYYLNRGIRLCDTIILVPLNFCSFNVSCLFNGLVYYDQWERLVWWQMVAVLFGIAILIGGVLIISWQPGYMASLAEMDDPALLPAEPDTQKQHSIPSPKEPSKWWFKLTARKKKYHNEPDERTRLLDDSS
ncbi:duf803 domain-containing protein [Lichtheimia corymbifera JMRC:FSU:9682]|uniref:Duf803 domain-containing protein n=1 Tax=Lichtheimia corymbifera JMRC:FSU:9682 TaxID=1263082 RepID=A0A068SA15_9FUNG|nr:duf803 domain-containing protein [Lichtheimia corymbifera JMRC:FSU:9682]